MNEWTEKKIFETVKSILSETLEIESEIIKPDSLIINDLGAESIDILDMSFRIEKAFKIKIPEQSFSPSSQNIQKGKKASEIFTVHSIVNFIKIKLKEAEVSGSY